MKKTLLIAALAALALGCNSTSQYIQTQDTNGVPIRMKAHTWNMLQADQSIGKIRVSDTKSGGKSIGVADVVQKSDMATAMEAAGGLVQSVAGAFAAIQTGGAIGGGTTVKTVLVTNTVAPPTFVDTNSATWPVTVKVADGKATVCYPNGACVVVPVTSK